MGGFGRLHTKPMTVDDKKENAEAEANREKARSLLRKSLKTRRSVKKAMDTMFDLKKQQARDRLRSQKQRHADAKAAEELKTRRSQELRRMYARIKQQTDDFNAQFGLGKSAATPAETVESDREMEREMVARAAKATSAVEQMEMGEGVH